MNSFHQVVKQIELLAKSGADVNLEDFYPPVKKHKSKSRDLLMVDAELRKALQEYLHLRICKAEKLNPSSPLFYDTERRPYSPNTLQEHLAFMLRYWSGIEKASSHSGHRSLITNIIHK